MSASRLLLATMALAAVLGLSHATACSYSCPHGYTAVPAFTDCSYTCYTAVKLNCLPQPIYNPMTRRWLVNKPSKLQLEAAKMRLCGGTFAPPCPSIACTYSSSYAISGPLGCATAKSYISSVAYSDAEFDFEPAFKEYYKGYSAYVCEHGYDAYTLSQYASSTAEAFAEAVAKAITHWGTYVCTCCKGNSAAYTTVKANVQAVANAAAIALAEAAAAVKGCDGNYLSISSSITEAVAAATELAIDSVYQKAVSFAGYVCEGDYGKSVKVAIAKATACAFASAYAEATSGYIAGDAASCSQTLAFSGDEWTVDDCKLLYCKP